MSAARRDRPSQGRHRPRAGLGGSGGCVKKTVRVVVCDELCKEGVCYK